MKRVVWLGFLFVVGCGGIDQARSDPNELIPVFTLRMPDAYPEIPGIVERFNNLMRHHPDYIEGAVRTIEVVDSLKELDEKVGVNTVGLCVTKKWDKGPVVRGSGHIYLKKDYWDHAMAVDKEAVLFHELGHCINGFGHLEGKPSIMNPTIPLMEYLTNNWAELMTDLLNQRS